MLYETLRFFKNFFIKPIYNIFQYKLIDKRLFYLYKNNYETLKSFVDVRTLKKATGELREVQLKNLKFTKEIIYELEQQDIKPFMMSGTLLGAERHNGYIPWDDDMDFGVTRADLDKIISYAKNKYHVYYQDINQYSYIKSSQKRINILLKEHPNQPILLIYPNIYKFIMGTSKKDLVQMDIFPFDYYKEDYKF